jgi:hypothetical protein
MRKRQRHKVRDFSKGSAEWIGDLVSLRKMNSWNEIGDNRLLSREIQENYGPQKSKIPARNRKYLAEIEALLPKKSKII